MANSPQSIKRARQAEKRRKHNQGIGTKFRTMLKRVRTGTDDGKTASADFITMQSATDIAARKGIIHPRKAARLKSRVNSLLLKNAAAKKSQAAEATEQKA